MKRAKAPVKQRPVRFHAFADSGYTTGTSKPERVCGDCLMPESWRAHQPPPIDPDAAALDARRTGDRGAS